MRKLLTYLRLSIIDSLIYRAEGIIWMINDIGPAVIALIFWSAAYQTRESFAGYSYSQMLVYYLGIMFVNNLINTQPQYYLSEEVRNGSFSNYLIKPINLALFKFISNNSWRLVRLIYFLPFLFIVAKIFGLNFSGWHFSAVQAGLIVFSLGLALIINFFIKLALGLTTIWFEESGWLFFGFDILVTFLSGELLPLDFFPSALSVINNILPFKYMLYFPLSLVLGNVPPGQELIVGFSYQIGWAIMAYLIYRRTLSRGSRVYSAFGG